MAAEKEAWGQYPKGHKNGGCCSVRAGNSQAAPRSLELSVLNVRKRRLWNAVLQNFTELEQAVLGHLLRFRLDPFAHGRVRVLMGCLYGCHLSLTAVPQRSVFFLLSLFFSHSACSPFSLSML